MGVEIERKFLVRRDLWAGSEHTTLIRQGYLSREHGRTVRARRAGDRAFLTIKGPGAGTEGLERAEFEYEVPIGDIDALLGLCVGPILEKRRHVLEHEGHTWEVDEFLGANDGLWVAELELERADEAFERPPWVGPEVSNDPRYLNANLVVHPFSGWASPNERDPAAPAGIQSTRSAPLPAKGPPMSDVLFSSYKLGPLTLKNRVVMSPMTRNRSIGNIPGDIVATYYAQRAEAGLIITEGTSPSANGLGYARIPGLYNREQVAAWKKVTAAVHANGGHIFVQLMHTGRASHPENLPKGARILAPSAVRLEESVFVDPDGPKPVPEPNAMTAADIEATVEEYVTSAGLAMEAGFDGVELHGANGYLIDQFLNTASNTRTDEWGGSVENRVRFAVEVTRRVAARIGKDRLGIRVSPYGVFNKMVSDPAIEDVYELLAKKLSDIGIAYIHIVDHSAMGAPEVKPSVKQKIRDSFKGTVILSGGYDRARAEADLVEGRGDLIAFGRPFLSNPRLVTKLRNGTALHAPDFATFYTPGEKGYTDYPVDG